MTNKDETPATQPPEWQSLRLDSRDNFGFCPHGDGVRRVARLNCFRMGREADLSRNGNLRCAIKNAPMITSLSMCIHESGPRCAIVGTVRRLFDIDAQ